MENDLKKRGYPKKVISNGIKKAQQHNRDELLQPKPKDKEDQKVFPVVTTHNHLDTNFFNIVSNTIQTLAKDQTFKSILPNLKLINSKRQPPRLSNYLIRAKFSQTRHSNYMVTKCKDKRCKTCDVILEGSKYILKKSAHTLQLREDMDCRATFVIYVIKCLGCGHDYIGSTKNLRHRVALHKNHIKQPQYEQCPVSSHLRTCSKGNFRIFPFYRIHDQNTKHLLTEELNFISKFKPKLNS